MLKFLFILIFLILAFFQSGIAQTFSISQQDSLCIGAETVITNASVGFEEYNWDFCQGDLKLTPTAEQKFNSNLNIPIGVDMIEANGFWFGFVNSFSANSLIMLEFGKDPTNPNPVEVNLGNLGGNLNGPQDISVVTYENEHFIFINNRVSNQLVRINLGSDIRNPSPTSDVILTGSGFGNGGLDISFDGSDWVVAITNFNFLTLVNLGSSPSNIPSEEDIMNTSIFPSANGIGDIKILKEGDKYFAFIASYESKTVHRLSFGQTLFSDPLAELLSVSELSSAALQPYGLSGAKENGEWVLFLVTIQGNLIRLGLGLDINNTKPTFNNIGNLSVLNNTLKLSLTYFNSRWIALTSNWSSSNYYIITFPESTCFFDKSFSDEQNTSIISNAPGNHSVTIRGLISSGLIIDTTWQVFVQNVQVPEVDIETGTNLCITDPITFTGISNETITSWTWNFGDGNSATSQNPEHTYGAAGEYEVTLSVEGANGCGNRITKTVTVYEPPTATFSSSAQGAICSQKPIAFTNTTDLPDIATYEWDFGDGRTSSLENPEHVYQNSGEYIVRLSVAFAGCESFTEQSITVNPGPEVSFSTIDNCLGQSVTFDNTSTGDFITSYLWNFGDGTTSTQENPVYSFETAGVKNISLTAFTSNGCDYTIQQNIEVFPVAVVDFEAEIACATQPVQFNEEVFLELSNVTDYLWDFGVAGRSDDISTFANPQFTFPEAGTYQVSLQVTTADGCVSSGQQSITVAQVPEPLFSYSLKCVGNSITFNGNSSTDVSSQYWELSNSGGEVISVGVNENFSYTFLSIGDYVLKYRQQNQQLCSNEYEETISILSNPVPSFTVSGICLNTPITFQNTTDLQGNTIETYNWLVDGEAISNDESTTFTFEEAGIYVIGLEAVTASGCIETASQTITLEPVAGVSFSLEQAVGAYPFPVVAEVSETAGFSYEWSINTQIVSTTPVLDEVLEAAGTYFINLAVTNTEGCISTASQQIRVRAPELDFSLSNLRVVSSGDFTEFVVSITNKGSVIPEEIDLNVDFGDYSITERVDRSINSESTVNYALNTKLSESQLRRLNRICLSASVKSSSLTEEQKEDNRVCTSLEDAFKVMDLYPNPASTQLIIPITIPENGNLVVSIEQSDGKQNQQLSYNLKAGYNEIKLERGNLKAGVYFVRIRYQGMEEVKKVVFR